MFNFLKNPQRAAARYVKKSRLDLALARLAQKGAVTFQSEFGTTKEIDLTVPSIRIQVSSVGFEKFIRVTALHGKEIGECIYEGRVGAPPILFREGPWVARSLALYSQCQENEGCHNNPFDPIDH